MISTKRLFVAAAMLFMVSLQSFADSFNNVWVKASVFPAGSGLVFVDWYLDDVNPAPTSEFKRSINFGASNAYIYAEPADGWLYAGAARDMNRSGQYEAGTDRQIHVWYNYFFTAFYDHKEYIGQSSTEAMELAEEALEEMTQPTDEVLAVFTKGAVARRAEGEEPFGYVFSSKLYNEPGDQVTFYAYGDVDSRNSPNVYYKFDSWRDASGNEVSRDREFTITVKGMEVYYAHFVKTTKAEYQATEKLPDQFKFDYNNSDWDFSGISSVSADRAASGVFYDLQGRRVSQPAKGVFIQNGKKIVVK